MTARAAAPAREQHEWAGRVRLEGSREAAGGAARTAGTAGSQARAAGADEVRHARDHYDGPSQRGFGYDPIFTPEGGALTFGEMEPTAKDAMSHRAQAFAKLKAALF